MTSLAEQVAEQLEVYAKVLRDGHGYADIPATMLQAASLLRSASRRVKREPQRATRSPYDLCGNKEYPGE